MSVAVSGEHRRGVAAAVDGDPQRHAVVGVPGELHRAEQAAVVPGRDPHRVGGLAGDVAGDRAAESDTWPASLSSACWICAIDGTPWSDVAAWSAPERFGIAIVYAVLVATS